MLMRRELLNGGLPAEEFVELTPRPRRLLSVRLRLCGRKTHSRHDTRTSLAECENASVCRTDAGYAKGATSL